jgi:cyclase
MKFEKPKYVGDPLNAIKIFNEKEVDEIIVLDIDASKNKTEPDYHLIEQFAGECFMPVCYGGGITSFEQAQRIFSLGIEKISLQSAVLNNMNLISEISAVYGNQAVVFSLDLKKNLFGNYKLFSSSKVNEISWKKMAIDAVNAGAGEILINSVDRDGTLQGLDIDILIEIKPLLSVPLIFCGGLNSLENIKLAVSKGADAIAGGAFFVFNGPHRAVLISYPKYNDLTSLFGG